jgi:hypothetical protein
MYLLTIHIYYITTIFSTTMFKFKVQDMYIYFMSHTCHMSLQTSQKCHSLCPTHATVTTNIPEVSFIVPTLCR